MSIVPEHRGHVIYKYTCVSLSCICVLVDIINFRQLTADVVLDYWK